VAHADELAEALESVLRREPADHWVTVLQAVSVPVGPINEVDEAFALAESLGMEPVETVDGVPLVRPPLRVDGERPPIRFRPPGLDEHGDDLRAWLNAP
jgi:crotonobetainyl-CoA:carnitine CoA-transferase CaiB-like acyl-CoA transferase